MTFSKYILLAATVCLHVFETQAQTPASNTFTIKGNLSGFSEKGKIYLTFSRGRALRIMDSCNTENGQFYFRDTLFPGALSARAIILAVTQKQIDARVSLMPEELNMRMFYLVPGETTITGNYLLKDATIRGATIYEDQRRLDNDINKFNEIWTNAAAQYQRLMTDSTQKDSLQYYHNISSRMMHVIDSLRTRFVEQNPSSLLSLEIVKERAFTAMDIYGITDIEKWLNHLSRDLRNSDDAEAIKAQIQRSRSLTIGNPALNFTSKDSTGTPVSLSSFRGKYVLVEFWASWCGPCRAQNPHLLKVYNTYKDKNLSFLSVSLDDDRKRWMKAVHEDKLPWLQLSDLKGMNSDVALLYNITSIPQNFLVDPNGVIVGKNFYNNELAGKLESIFNK